MQTSLARRQRHRRNGNGRKAPQGGAARRIAIALPLLLFASLLLLGVVGLVGAVAAYNYFSTGLQDPKTLLQNLTFDQQTIVYDRTGKVELARLGELKREVTPYAQIPAALVDATTSIEDKTFWDNAGFDPVGIISAGVDTIQGNERGASTITQQLVRARLLPSDVLAGSKYERKIKEIIQSIRLTQELPSGTAGKEAIMEAYLNQNFYGNQSYGVAAAAKGYFGKTLDKLDLAQMAILAAIPKSPTNYDLVRNATEECSVTVAAGDDCPAGKSQLVVPADSPIVVRRNAVLTAMVTNRVLTRTSLTDDEIQAAMREPVVLTPQSSQQWKAAQFVWQVRSQLGALLCGAADADSCEKVDTGGYHVTTTLDWAMQQSTEKWVYAAARAPNRKDMTTILKRLKIPASDQGWIRQLRNRNINNAAAGIEDARTGQILAYVGSASYTDSGNKKFQPQFDVLSDGWRQPGSAIKPIDYAIGIDDHTLTAATMFMDVVTDFGNDYTPTQADSAERGPVLLRSALQFSLNVPAVKAGFYIKLDHELARTKDFGIHYLKGTQPVISQSIGTQVMHPIDLLGAYSAIANGGRLMPRTLILTVSDTNGTQVWPPAGSKPSTGKKVVSPQTAYIVTDILSGNTDSKVNPFWGEWKIVDRGRRREAAYKTGTTSDNKDVTAFGFLAPPEDPKAPQLVAGVWMGNSDNTPNGGSLSLDSSAPLWSRILGEASKGDPFASFASSRPKGIDTVTVDAFSGMLPGPFTVKTVKELFIAGTAPTKPDDTKRAVTIDRASGLLWQDGCAGPQVTIGAFDVSKLETRFPKWQRYTQNWAARAARGVGVRGGPEGTHTAYFYGSGFFPFGRTWGAPFAPSKTCTPAPPSPSPTESCDPLTGLCVSPGPSVGPSPEPTATPKPTPKPTPAPKPKPSPSPTPKH
ncbi:MAG TPA: transglycosylase domain-containing protein [Candidatus Limnocylindrales bacterium]|nr:transglycosylase domain-containing protein [Candidatus Limnocylindrales bacterium]